ncbi:MAG: hypothetical protein M1818_003427 [Claussenomyces sp. TS43310]|nr:MAG: hypothetical protein M1818_003427 [Claussenomyces sp. TS43310]
MATKKESIMVLVGMALAHAMFKNLFNAFSSWWYFVRFLCGMIPYYRQYFIVAWILGAEDTGPLSCRFRSGGRADPHPERLSFIRYLTHRSCLGRYHGYLDQSDVSGDLKSTHNTKTTQPFLERVVQVAPLALGLCVMASTITGFFFAWLWQHQYGLCMCKINGFQAQLLEAQMELGKALAQCRTKDLEYEELVKAYDTKNTAYCDLLTSSAVREKAIQCLKEELQSQDDRGKAEQEDAAEEARRLNKELARRQKVIHSLREELRSREDQRRTEQESAETTALHHALMRDSQP